MPKYRIVMQPAPDPPEKQLTLGDLETGTPFEFADNDHDHPWEHPYIRTDGGLLTAGFRAFNYERADTILGLKVRILPGIPTLELVE